VNSQAALHEHTATPIPVNINEVSNLPVLTDDIIIAEGEAAAEQFEELGGSTRRQILPMALGLAAARRMYPADDKFGSWLAVRRCERSGLLRWHEKKEGTVCPDRPRLKPPNPNNHEGIERLESI
jgi:hypothetical protein